MVGEPIHDRVLVAGQRAALRKLGPWSKRAGFYLGGGTAVALHLRHRRSVDFDWFTQDEIPDGLALVRRIQDSGIAFEPLQVGPGTLHGRVSGVRVSLLEYRYDLLAPVVEWPAYDCGLASLDDLACMKLAAIAQRGSRKDFLDIYALGEQHRPLSALLTLYQRKYGLADIGHVLYGLTYFNVADEERMPRLIWDMNWRRVKTTIRRWVQEVAGMTAIIRHEVDSTSLKSVGYDKETRVLQIEFQTGKVYDYYDVPEQVFESLMSASSLGEFFNQEVRPVFRYAEQR